MFDFLHKNIIFQSFLLLVLLALCAFSIFSSLRVSDLTGAPVLAGSLQHLHTHYPLLLKIVTFLTLVLQLILLQHFIHKNSLTEDKTLYPSVIYLALLAGGQVFTSLNSVFFINLFIILLLLLNSGYENASIKNRVFMSGALVGVISFLDIASAVTIFFIFISLTVNRFSKAKDILLTIFGFGIPIIYFFSYYLFTDQYVGARESLQQLHFLGFFDSISYLGIRDYLAFSALALYLLYMGITLNMIFSKKLIVMRRRLISIHAMTVCLFAITLLTYAGYPSLLTYLFLPVAVYYSISSQYKANWIFNDILSLFLIILLCL